MSYTRKAAFNFFTLEAPKPLKKNELLQDEKSKEWSIDFSDQKLGHIPYIFTALANTFDEKINKDEVLTIDFSSNYLTLNSIKEIAGLLRSGNLPNNVTLRLDANDLDDESAQCLVAAARSEKAPTNLVLNLENNRIKNTDALQNIANLNINVTLLLRYNLSNDVGNPQSIHRFA